MTDAAAKFSLQSDCQQLYIFADSLDEKVATSINNLMGLRGLGLPISDRKSIEITLARKPHPFHGLNGRTYSPPFTTRVALQVLAGRDTQQYKDSLEILANKVLETIPGRCVVYDLDGETYRKGF